MKGSTDATCRVHVLAVSPFESDRIALVHIFGHTAWAFDCVRTVEEASKKLRELTVTAGAPVVLCYETLADGTWKDVLNITQSLPQPHNLIVTSDRADDRLWAEVLNLGAYDVLQRPFRAQELFRSIGLAWTDGRKPAAVSTRTLPVRITAVA